jgi:hypothetical protein
MGMNPYLQVVLLMDDTVDKPVRLSLLVAAYRVVSSHALLSAITLLKDAQNS